MHTRIATSLDRDNIQSVHWSAFAEGEREIVSRLVTFFKAEVEAIRFPGAEK